MSKQQHVTKAQPSNTAVAKTEFDYSAFSNQGFENTTKDDYAVPLLGVLQPLSPLLETSADAKAGMLVNTVTKDVYDGKKGITFIPVMSQRKMVEWIPKDQGGGLVATHEMDSEIVQKAKAEQEWGKLKSIKGDPKSHDLVETVYLYGLFVHDDGGVEQMIIPFTSTKLKVAKILMNKAHALQFTDANGKRGTYPLFAHKYRVTTVQEKNAKGTWHNFAIAFDGKDANEARLPTNESLFQDAAAFFKLIREGTIKGAYESEKGVAGEAEEEIPFA